MADRWWGKWWRRRIRKRISSRTRERSLSRWWTTGWNQWWRVINLGTISRKGHDSCSSFCWSSQGDKSAWGSTYQQAQRSTDCHHGVCTEIVQLLGKRTNLYYRQHLDTQSGSTGRLPAIRMSDLMTFIALAVQAGHDLEDALCGCRCILWQLHTLFYSETMTWNRFLHMLCFLHFACSLQRPEEGEDYDWLTGNWGQFLTHWTRHVQNSITPEKIWLSTK